MRLTLSVFCTTIWLLFFSLADAQTKKPNTPEKEKFALSAKSMDRDYEKGVVYLKGNVKVAFGKKKISCDSAELWENSKLIVASGNAVIAGENFEMQGERIEYDYQNDSGNIFNGSVRSGKVLFKGEKLEKVGPANFKAEQGTYTACDCDPPTWSFAGRDIDAEMGGYAFVKWPLLKVANIPIFGLPYIIVPLKSSRQTGLLMPTFENTQDGGTALGESIFLAINESRDATVTLKYYQERSLKSMIEHRQKFSEFNSSEFDFGFLNDNAFGKSNRLNRANLGKPYDRWHLKYKHYFDLPNNYEHRAQINWLSDIQYLSDFHKEIEEPGNPSLESRMSITKKSANFITSIDATYYQNMLKTDPFARNDDAVHRLPEIRLNILERPIAESNLLFKFDMNYVNFARNSLAYDDVVTIPFNNETKVPEHKGKGDSDNSFDPNVDLIRTGQRLDFQPSLSYILTAFDFLQVVPSLSFRETQYHFPLSSGNFTSEAVRRYFKTEVAARIRFDRVYPGEKTSFKHEIIPEISWSNVPYIEQPENHPFFGNLNTNYRLSQKISDLDMLGTNPNRLQFDYNDRVIDRKLMTLMLTNKIIRKRLVTGLPDYKQVGLIRLWQHYDFIEASRLDNLTTSPSRPWSEINALLDFRFENFESNTLVQYLPYHALTNYQARVKFISNIGNFLQFTYLKNYDVSSAQVTLQETLTPEIGFNTKYLNLSGGPEYNMIASEFGKWRAQLGLKPPGNCIILIVDVSQTPPGKPEVEAKINFSFDGT